MTRLCIRFAAFCFEFLLVDALSSTDSAGTAVPLFAGVCGTMAPSDSSVACSMGVRLLTFPTSSNFPSKRGQLDPTEVSRFSCRERPHMPGSMTPPNPVVTRVGSLPLMLPSPAHHRVGIRDEVISELNSPPVLSPVNASPRPRGPSRHDSGPE